MKEFIEKFKIFIKGLFTYLFNGGSTIDWGFFKISLGDLTFLFIIVNILWLSLHWIISILRYLLKIFRWILIFWIISKIILDILSGEAINSYNLENFKQSVGKNVSSVINTIGRWFGIN